MNIIWETKLYYKFALAIETRKEYDSGAGLYCKFALAKRDRTSNTIWETELYFDPALAEEISAKFGVGRKRNDNECNSWDRIILWNCGGKREM